VHKQQIVSDLSLENNSKNVSYQTQTRSCNACLWVFQISIETWDPDISVYSMRDSTHFRLSHLVRDPISFVGGPWCVMVDLDHWRVVTMLYRYMWGHVPFSLKIVRNCHIYISAITIQGFGFVDAPYTRIKSRNICGWFFGLHNADTSTLCMGQSDKA